jgi:hypothetical protein
MLTIRKPPRQVVLLMGSPFVATARIGAALLVLAAGAIHLWLYFDFFHRVHVIGVLFVVNAAVAFLIGVPLLVSGSRVLVAAGVAYAAGTLAAFFISVYHGLFGYVESLSGSWQLAAGAVEIAAIMLLLPILAPSLRDRRPGSERRRLRVYPDSRR